MLDYGLKIIIIFLVTIAAMRLMGKSTIVQLTPYDLVAILIASTIITEPLVTTNLWKALFGLAVLVGLYVLISRLTLFDSINKFLLGEPTILVKQGKVIEENLKKAHISMMQLLSSLRVSGYPDLSDVDYVLLEPIGALSVIPKSCARPLSPGDLGIKVKYEGLPLGLIIDGKIHEKNLKLVHKDEEWLRHRLSKEGVTEINKVLFASLDAQGKFFLDLRTDEVKEEHLRQKIIPLEKKLTSKPPRLTVVPSRKPMPYLVDKAIRREENSITLIKNGMMQIHGLRKANLRKKSLLSLLKRQGVSDIHKVREAWLDRDRNIRLRT